MYSSVYRQENCALFRLLQAVFLRFLSFSVTVKSSKFKKTRVFQHSLISSGMENRLYSSVSGRFLLVFWRSQVQKIRVKLGKHKIFPRFPLYLLWKLLLFQQFAFSSPVFNGIVTFSINLIQTGKISCMSQLFRNSHPAIEVLWLLLFVNACKTQGIVIVQGVKCFLPTYLYIKSAQMKRTII